MNKLITLFLAILFCVTQIFSIGQEWVSRYNGAGNTLDWAYAITMDPSGNIIVTGYSTGSGTGKDYKTIKYDQTGNILWVATYNGPINGGDYSNALAVDNSGNIFVTGRVDYGPTSADIVTIKYNSSGVQQWASRYSGAANGVDEGKTIHLQDDGSVIVGGKTTTASTGIDFIIIKYNSDGTEAWVSTYTGPGANEDYVIKADIDASGNVYAGGCSIGAGTGLDLAVVKYNSSGVQQWVKRYNGAGNGGDALVGLQVDNSGNVVAGGYCDNGPATMHDFLTIKYDPAGNVLWEKRFDGSSHITDVASAMVVDASDNIYLTGLATQMSGTRPDSNYATVKYDPSGNLQWATYYDGPSNSVDVSRSIFVDNNLNVYITGSSKGINSDDYATVKYSSSGVQQWVMSYNGTGNSNDYSSSLIADNEGNAYVTGRSTGSGTDYDYATIKYGNLVGINPVNNEIPVGFSLMQNYPNPFNPSTNIRFSIPEALTVSLLIFDAAGKEVKDIQLGSLKPANYEYSFDASGLTSGVYFYRIVTAKFTETKKMILVK